MTDRREIVFWALAILGTVVPFWFIGPWLYENGLDLPLLLTELFSNRVAAFFGVDVIVSALVLFALVWFERHKQIKLAWLAIPATLFVGVSLGLPLYLALRAWSARAPA